MTLRSNIDALRAERQQERFDEAEALFDSVLSGRNKTPDAPHPDPEVRRRSRRVFEHVRRVLFIEHMPWHHRDIWLWAASASAGAEWVELVVAAWERDILVWQRRKKKLERQRSATPFVDEQYVFDEDDAI